MLSLNLDVEQTNGSDGPLRTIPQKNTEPQRNTTQNPVLHERTQNDLSDLPVYAIEATSHTDLLRTEGRLGQHVVRILIDGGSRGNFINNQLVQRVSLCMDTHLMQPIIVTDGSHYTATLVPACELEINEYRERFDFLAAPISFDIILGKPWLEKYNPDIDWMKNLIKFSDSHGKTHSWIALEYNVDDIFDNDIFLSATQLKKKLRDPTIRRSYYCLLTDIEEFNVAVDHAITNQPTYLRDVLHAFPRVFSGVTGMPPVRPTDHRIELTPGAMPPFQPIYHMSERELQLLKEELTRLMTLGHIRRSISPYGAPVFFIEEWTGKIRMVTDYRALNELTVKNQTALPNIWNC